MSTYIQPGTNKLHQYEDSCPLLNDFLNHIVVLGGRSVRTANTYYVILRHFIRYLYMDREQILEKDLKKHGETISDVPIDHISLDFFKDVTRQDISDYMVYLASQGNDVSTRKNKLTAIRTFFTYLVSEHELSENPALYIPTPKLPSREPKYLTQDDVQALLTAASNQKNKERDYCITILLLTTGMRLSELCALNIDSFRSDGTCRIIGKGNKERTVYLGETAKKALNDWLEVRDGYQLDKEEKALFVGLAHKEKKRITGRAVENIITKELNESGLSGQGYSVHKLRHTAATLMYSGGAGIMELKDLLGHESTKTTEIYTHINNEQLRRSATIADDLIGSIEDRRNQFTDFKSAEE